jgi:hypothetical protein
VRADLTVDTRAVSRADSRGLSRDDSRADWTVETKAVSKADSRADSRVDFTVETKAVSKAVSKADCRRLCPHNPKHAKMPISATIAWKIGFSATITSSMMPSTMSPTMASTQPPTMSSGIAMRVEMKRMKRACHMILMPMS